MPRRPKQKPTAKAYIWDTVLELMLSSPDVEESTSYGTPALKRKGNLFARLHQAFAGTVAVVRCEIPDRVALIRKSPDVFFFTDHYLKHPWVLVHLASVSREELARILDDAWRLAGDV
jgi:hypothetical protein